MRKFKPGFTLAEVLITLGIIGVVAAIVMPSVITSYQYKTVGVKLSKFASLVENATRPFVVQNDVFSTENPDLIEDFVNESFIITDVIGASEKKDENGAGTGEYEAVEGTAMTLSSIKWSDLNKSSLVAELSRDNNGNIDAEKDPAVVKLKDGTMFSVTIAGDNAAVLSDDNEADIPVDFVKVGEPVFVFDFDPRVTGLPKDVQKTFSFVVTELGYVYPNDKDNCLEAIYQADFATNARLFRDTGACSIGGAASNEGQGGNS